MGANKSKLMTEKVVSGMGWKPRSADWLFATGYLTLSCFLSGFEMSHIPAVGFFPKTFSPVCEGWTRASTGTKGKNGAQYI